MALRPRRAAPRRQTYIANARLAHVLAPLLPPPLPLLSPMLTLLLGTSVNGKSNASVKGTTAHAFELVSPTL